MKKIAALISIILVTIISIAKSQVSTDSSVHLTFKGVPINGTLAEFISKMKQSGFAQEGTGDGITLLKGDFASYINCIVQVSTLKQKDLVSKIAVVFPQCENWSLLSSNYFQLKEMLTEKYGKPSDFAETFQSYVQPKDEGGKFIYVQLNKCKYYTVYETGKGSIHLSIENDNMHRCFVKLSYSDKVNSETVKKRALDDL